MWKKMLKQWNLFRLLAKVTMYQIFSTFFSIIFSVYVDYNRTWQFDSFGMLQDTKNELRQNILLL